MERGDFLKLVGASSGSEDYLPVAFLLNSGYACAGYYHAGANDGLTSTCVLLNAQLMELRAENRTTGRPAISDFSEFLEEIAVQSSGAGEGHKALAESALCGKRIPLTAIPFEQIAVIYPVAHIGALLKRAERQDPALPRFLDFDQSELVRLLRTRLW
jgi:hypothetical protein